MEMSQAWTGSAAQTKSLIFRKRGPNFPLHHENLPGIHLQSFPSVHLLETRRNLPRIRDAEAANAEWFTPIQTFSVVPALHRGFAIYFHLFQYICYLSQNWQTVKVNGKWNQ